MTLYDDINIDWLTPHAADRTPWLDRAPSDRAQAILDWCHWRELDTGSVTARPLANAIAAVHTQPQPSDYLRAVQLLVAYGRAR